MAEHLLIGDLAALLLVLGFTGPLLAPLLRNRAIGWLRVFTHPVVAVTAWAINFYVWHLPALYQAALRHDAIHALEHATFLGFGIAVWMGLLGPLPKPQWFGNGARLVYIIAVRLIGTVLANAMIFSGTVFYPYYRTGRRALAHQLDRRPGRGCGADDGRGEPAHDRPLLLAVPEGRARSRGAPAAARLRRGRRGSSSTSAGRRGRWLPAAARSLRERLRARAGTT